MTAAEWSPPSRGTSKMTKKQVAQYIANMKKAQKKAEEKIIALQKSWELKKEEEEIAKLWELLDDDKLYT